MGEYKYQHYVPQTYLKSWLDDNNKLYLYDSMTNCLIKECRPKKILIEKDLYTKTVNEILICTDEDNKKIFHCLKEYNVYIKGEKLDEKEYARRYFEFDDWIIKDKNGNLVNKKKIKNEIEQVRILTIEKNWKKIEDNWNDLKERIEEGIEKGNLTIREVNDLKDFIICQQWRTKDKIEYYKQMIDKILGVIKDDLKENYEKILNEFARCIFLKKLTELQNRNEQNHIVKVRKMLDELHMVFYKAVGNKSFITSDNPIFFIDNNDNLKKGMFMLI